MTKFDAQHLDEWLSAYLDGELTEKEALLVEQVLREDESARRRLADLRRTVSLVTGLPRRAAPPTLSEEILARLERTELLGDVEQPHNPKARRRRRVPVWTSLAAALALTVVSGWWMFLSPRSGGTNGSRIAQRSAEPQGAAPAAPPSNAVGPSQPTDAMTSRRETARRSPEERLASAERKQDVTELTAKRAVPDPTATDAKIEKLKTTAVGNESKIAAPAASTDGASAAPVDLNAKLAAGFDETKVRTHRYPAESVRLHLEVHSGDDVEKVAGALRSQLLASGVSDLEGGAASGGDPSTKAPARFFQRGRPGDNFDGDESRQWIARVRAADLEAVLRELRTLGVRDADVSLSAGTSQFKGSASVRGALESVASRVGSKHESETDATGEAGANGAASSERRADRGSSSPSSVTPATKSRVRTSDQWTAMLDTIAQAFTSPVKESATGSIEPAPAQSGAATPVDAPLSVDGVKSNESIAVSDTASAKVDTTDAGVEPNRSGGVAGVTRSAGLVARRSKAAEVADEVALANRPAAIEPTPPASAPALTTGTLSDAANAHDRSESETNEAPLITLVIELSVAPDAPSTPSGASAPSPARARPVKQPAVTPTSR